MKREISIIVPVYNVEKYLEQCIESILAQTFKDYELILVNDGSKDRCPEILKKYECMYPDIIRCIYQENQGLAKTRNNALDIAEGNYVIFLDSDDYIGKDYVKNLYDAAIKYDSDMVICNYTKVTEEGNVIQVHNANYCAQGIRIPSYISPIRIIRRALLEKYHIRYLPGTVAEDIPFVLKLEAVANNIVLISESGYYYRTNPTSITSTFKRTITKEKLPIQSLEESIQFCLKHNKNFSEKELAFFICRIWTTLIFDTGRGSSKYVRNAMCDAVVYVLNTYFPDYYNNPYLKLNAFPELPRVQKWGPWILVIAVRFRMLNLLSWIASLI